VVPDSISGDYQLTFTASPSCSLTPQVMRRTYHANVGAWVDHSAVAVEVSGARFYRDWGIGFDGTRDGDTVRFKIVGVPTGFPDSFYDSGLAEVIDQTKWLTYDGTAVVHIAGNSVTMGTFDGLIALRDASSEATLVECRARDHKVEFAR
jgi:hypothetical protein